MSTNQHTLIPLDSFNGSFLESIEGEWIGTVRGVRTDVLRYRDVWMIFGEGNLMTGLDVDMDGVR